MLFPVLFLRVISVDLYLMHYYVIIHDIILFNRDLLDGRNADVIFYMQNKYLVSLR